MSCYHHLTWPRHRISIRSHDEVLSNHLCTVRQELEDTLFLRLIMDYFHNSDFLNPILLKAALFQFFHLKFVVFSVGQKTQLQMGILCCWARMSLLLLIFGLSTLTRGLLLIVFIDKRVNLSAWFHDDLTSLTFILRFSWISEEQNVYLSF